MHRKGALFFQRFSWFWAGKIVSGFSAGEETHILVIVADDIGY